MNTSAGHTSTCNWIFTPLLPFEGTSRHPQLCQGWVSELSVAVPLCAELLPGSQQRGTHCCCSHMSPPCAVARLRHTPAPRSSLEPQLLLFAMSPCTPSTPFPTNFLATPVHISTLKCNKDATWATCSCSGGVSCPEASAVPVHCKPSPRCHTVQFQFSQPKPYLRTRPMCYLAHVPRLLGQPFVSSLPS